MIEIFDQTVEQLFSYPTQDFSLTRIKHFQSTRYAFMPYSQHRSTVRISLRGQMERNAATIGFGWPALHYALADKPVDKTHGPGMR